MQWYTPIKLRLQAFIHLFPRPTSDAHQERCYPSTKHTGQNYLFLHSAEIGHCHSTQPLATTLNPIWRARKESDLSWYWDGGTLTILPSMRALVPDFWQLDALSFLLSASFRIRSPIWQANFICQMFQYLLLCSKSCKVLGLQPRGALSSQHKVKVMFHHGKRAWTLLQRVAWSTLLSKNQSTFIKVPLTLLEITLDSFSMSDSFQTQIFPWILAPQVLRAHLTQYWSIEVFPLSYSTACKKMFDL